MYRQFNSRVYDILRCYRKLGRVVVQRSQVADRGHVSRLGVVELEKIVLFKIITL